MIMYDVLLILFKAANILAIALLIGSYVGTVIARIRKSIVSTAYISFPVFSDQHTLIKHSFWCGTLFLLLNWLLCSSRILSVSGGSVNALSETLMIFALVWAITIFVGIVTEVVIKCFKSGSSESFSVIGGVKSSIWYSALYFILSFLIA